MKISIVDDHPLVRRGLSSILSLEKGNEIAGEAANVHDALKMIECNKPDLVLVDLRLGEECGLDIVREIKEEGMDCKFLILTSSTSSQDFHDAQVADVDGYILKEALPEELLYAIRLIGQGRKYYDSSIIEMMMKGNGPDSIEKLTPREYEVLISLGKGMSNSEIGKKLFITEFTVKKHVGQILAKLGLSDRTQAALYANSKGLVKYL